MNFFLFHFGVEKMLFGTITTITTELQYTYHLANCFHFPREKKLPGNDFSKQNGELS